MEAIVNPLYHFVLRKVDQKQKVIKPTMDLLHI